MKWFPIVCYLGIAGWQVAAHLDEILPSDPAKREALHLCFLANHRFDPLDAAARDACFKGHQLQPDRRNPTTHLMPLGVTAHR